MNKLVLEKLLHLYKLVPEKTNVDLEINYDNEGNKSWNQADDKWLNFVNATLLPEWKTKKVTMEKQRTKTYLKKVSDQIQQSGKFFADLSYLKELLSDDDLMKLFTELPVVLPYQWTFFQCTDLFTVGDFTSFAQYNSADFKKNTKKLKEETNEQKLTMNYLLHQENIDEPIIRVFDFVYHTDVNKFQLDPVSYQIDLTDPNDYVKKFFYTYDPDLNQNGGFANQYINNGEFVTQNWDNHIHKMVLDIAALIVMLAYPQLSTTKDVGGKRPVALDSSAKYKVSELRKRPAWEHKVLNLNISDEEKRIIENERANPSKSKRFHAVRSHVRKLASGKITLVKSHFRGNKDLGVIQKDYKITNATIH